MPQRESFEVRICSLAEQGLEDDLRATTAAQRLQMMWQLAVDAWSFQEGADVESRLQRHVVRVERRGR